MHTGVYLTFGAFLCVLFPIGHLLVRSTNDRAVKVGNYLKSRFRFNFFIRYGIEHYVIFTYACLDQLRHFSFSTHITGISSLIAILGIAVVHFAPAAILAFLLKHKSAITSTDLDYAPFKEKWSSLLEEFRKMSFYQVAFLGRRLVLGYALAMTSNALIQTSISALAGTAVRTNQTAVLVIVTLPFAGRFDAGVQLAEEVLGALISCVLVLYTPEIGHSSEALLYLMVAQVVLHMAALVAAIGLGIYALFHSYTPVAQAPASVDAIEQAKLYETLESAEKREVPELNFDEVNSRVPALPESVGVSTRLASPVPNILPTSPDQDLLMPSDQRPQFSPITRSR